MFGFGAKSKAKKLMDVITEFSGILAGRKEVFPYGGNVKDIECVLVGMSCFLVVGFAGDNNLAYELVPTYQKRIMPTVNKLEYDTKTQLVQKYFSEYRENAISIQESQKDWFTPMVDKFAELSAMYFNVDFTEDCHSTLCACILQLISAINPKLNV